MKKVLVIFLPGLGLDGSDFAQIVPRVRAEFGNELECLPLTFPGFEVEPEPGNSPASMLKHSIFLRNILGTHSKEYAQIILWGFSYGADVMAYFFSKEKLPSDTNICAIYNDPNVNANTCTISKAIVNCPKLDDGLTMIVDILNSLSEKITKKHSLFQYRDVLMYLYKIGSKDLSNIRCVASNMVLHADENPGWILDGKKKGVNTYVYFSSEIMKEQFLSAIQSGSTKNDWVQIMTGIGDHFMLMSDSHILTTLKSIMPA